MKSRLKTNAEKVFKKFLKVYFFVNLLTNIVTDIHTAHVNENGVLGDGKRKNTYSVRTI